MYLIRLLALLFCLTLPASAQIATGPLSAPGIDGMGVLNGGGTGPAPPALAFNNAANVGNNGGTGNFSAAFNNTAGTALNQLLVVCIVGTTANNASSITGVSYAGTSLTLAKSFNTSGTVTTRWLYQYYGFAPATGSNTLAVTQSGGDYLIVTAAVYTGVKQSTQPDAAPTPVFATTSPATASITTVNEYSWVTGCGQAPSAIAAGTGETQRAIDASFGNLVQFDSNGPEPGTTSYSTTSTSNNVSTLLVSYAPASSVPPQAQAWSFNNQTFADTFSAGLSEIDVNATANPGYVWYPQDFFDGQVATAPGDISISGGLLTINGSVNNTPSYRSRLLTRGNTSSTFTATSAAMVLNVSAVNAGTILPGQVLAGANIAGTITIQPYGTAGTTGTGGTGTYALSSSLSLSSQAVVGQSSVGRLFPPGGYYEACFSFDPSLAVDQNSGWPSWWMQDIAGLYAQNLTSAYSTAAHFGELDHFEGIPTGVGTVQNTYTVNDWTNTNGGGFGGDNKNSVGVSNATLGNPTFTNQNCYGTLWVLSTQNAGTGLIQRYFNGKHIASLDCSYSSGAPASCAATPSNPNGTFFILESGQFPLILDAGYHNPINVSSVTVWH